MPGDPEIIFKKPPAREVQLAVQFPNNFEVADDRSRFHSLIKREFPLVVIPEQTKLLYDFGDYSIWTQNQANRLEIGMNYFRLATTSYFGFIQFRMLLFLNALGIFSKCYQLQSFTSLAMQYQLAAPRSRS